MQYFRISLIPHYILKLLYFISLQSVFLSIILCQQCLLSPLPVQYALFLMVSWRYDIIIISLHSLVKLMFRCLNICEMLHIQHLQYLSQSHLCSWFLHCGGGFVCCFLSFLSSQGKMLQHMVKAVWSIIHFFTAGVMRLGVFFPSASLCWMVYMKNTKITILPLYADLKKKKGKKLQICNMVLTRRWHVVFPHLFPFLLTTAFLLFLLFQLKDQES